MADHVRRKIDGDIDYAPFYAAVYSGPRGAFSA